MLLTMADKRGEMTYEDIMNLFRKETRSPQLAKVDPSLYATMNTYLRNLRKESEREMAMNSSSHASMMLNDQLKKAVDKSKRVYELRQRKIALLALRKVSGDNPDTGNLTSDELVLLSSLISVLGAHKDKYVDFEDSEMVHAEVGGPMEADDEPETGGCDEEPAAEVADAEPTEGLVLARVLEDVPTFAGVDRDYKLRREDIVSLPETIAKTLVSHGKIKLVDSR
jgi:DNA replication factor GINS